MAVSRHGHTRGPRPSEAGVNGSDDFQALLDSLDQAMQSTPPAEVQLEDMDRRLPPVAPAKPPRGVWVSTLYRYRWYHNPGDVFLALVFLCIAIGILLLIL